jgi:hypothetical protein
LRLGAKVEGIEGPPAYFVGDLVAGDLAEGRVGH